MSGIVWSICAIGLVMAVGWEARRRGIIGPDGSSLLATLTYWVTSPAMLFHAISTTDVLAVLGGPLVAAAGCGVGAALVFVLIGAGPLRLRGGDLALGAMSASLNNAAYIGIPIALYVLGDATHVVPILVFQLGFFTPMFFVLADVTGSGRAPTPSSVVLTIVKNPMVIAAAFGFVFAALKIPVPKVLAVSTSMLGDAAAPVILLAFGASLVGARFPLHDRHTAAVLVASACKLLAQPLIAYGIGLLLGMRGVDLMTVTIMAGLPTAQNAFIAASRAGTGERIAQGAALLTTLASLPLTICTAGIFHAFLGV